MVAQENNCHNGISFADKNYIIHLHILNDKSCDESADALSDSQASTSV